MLGCICHGNITAVMAIFESPTLGIIFSGYELLQRGEKEVGLFMFSGCLMLFMKQSVEQMLRNDACESGT